MAQFFQQHRSDRLAAGLLVQPIPIDIDPLVAIRRLHRVGARSRSHHFGTQDGDRHGKTRRLQTTCTAQLA